MKRGEHLLGGIEGPVGPTLLVVLETLGYTTVDEGFRGKDDPSSFNLSVENFAHIDPHLISKAHWNDDLIFVFDGDNGHGGTASDGLMVES